MSRIFQKKSVEQNSPEMYDYYQKKKLFWGLVLLLSVLLVLVSGFFALLFGSAGPIGPVSTSLLTVSDVIEQITKNSLNFLLQVLGIPVQEEDSIQKVIIWDIRLPRVIMGALAGMALAVTGTIMQAIFRNPMADPYILGLASGALIGLIAFIISFILGKLLDKYEEKIYNEQERDDYHK